MVSSSKLILPSLDEYHKAPGRAWLRIALDTRRARREGWAGMQARQAARLREIVRYARTYGPYYRDHYTGLPDDPPLDEIPPVNKPALMERFEDWVTDDRVKLCEVEAFIADESRVGLPFAGQYAVKTTRYLNKYESCRMSQIPAGAR